MLIKSPEELAQYGHIDAEVLEFIESTFSNLRSASTLKIGNAMGLLIAHFYRSEMLRIASENALKLIVEMTSGEELDADVAAPIRYPMEVALGLFGDTKKGETMLDEIVEEYLK